MLPSREKKNEMVLASLGITASESPNGVVCSISLQRGGIKRKVTMLGIDIAKSVFALHGVDERGRTVLRA
ncbi:hypothetical protein LFML04_1781 [Leptospirillum ferriphilum ML-04]|uniref:Uncharacterized protein n=1 Tax=Leptospirillum ferriphilum (strain ML-04) TaxID=1048260 RepID=J9ZCU6_LEPFM|nr:hypothetical protein LFML04_1781 [Leptospirillum ferriphilum ML-04]